MKKLIGMLTIVFMIFSVTACTVQNAGTPPVTTPDTQTSSGKDVEPVDKVSAWGVKMKELYNGQTVNCLVATHMATDAYTALIPKFTEMTGIKINMKVMASNDMKTLQKTSSASKSGTFDLYMLDTTMIAQFAGSGFILKLDSYLNDPVMTPDWFGLDDILPAYLTLCTYEKSIYGIPIACQCPAIVGYRTDLFEKYNKTPPKDLDEMLELAQFFKSVDEDVSGFVTRGAAGTYAGNVFNALMYCFSDDPFRNHITKEYAIPDDMISCFEYIAALAACGPADMASFTHEDATAYFAQGKSAMWMDSSDMALNVVKPEASVVADKVAFMPIPNGPAGGSGNVGGWTLALTSDGKSSDAAYAFLMYVTSEEMAHEYINNGGGPNRMSIFTDPELVAKQPLYKTTYEAVQAAGKLADRGCTFFADSPYYQDIRVMVGNELNRVFAGEIDAATALANCQKQLPEIVSQ